MFVRDDVEHVAHSELEPVVLGDDDAASRAAGRGRHSEVSRSAALATMDEESTPATDLLGFEMVQIERAWPCLCRVMHCILAILKLIARSGQWADTRDALHGRVHETLTSATVPMGVHVPVARSADEVPRVLVVGVVLRRSVAEGLATLGQTSLLLGDHRFD